MPHLKAEVVLCLYYFENLIPRIMFGLRLFHRGVRTARIRLWRPGHLRVQAFSLEHSRNNSSLSTPPLSSNKPQRRFDVSTFLLSAFAAILGYGAANYATGSGTTSAILDDSRLPDVKYAKLSDMEKVILILYTCYMPILTRL